MRSLIDADIRFGGTHIFRFGTFELDVRTGELCEGGRRFSLPEQSLRILKVLLERPGGLVTRDELCSSLWSSDTFVAFDDSLNTAIRRLRRTLGDTAEKPHFIETLRRRGYRFMLPVERADVPLSGNNHSTPRVAVLPLENVSGDPAQQYFADAITDTLITELAKSSSLSVTSRSSVAPYKGTCKALPEIGRELGVDVVVECVVMRSGDRVRITAKLVRASTDQHLWAEGYVRELRDVLALQRELAQSISSQILINLASQDASGLTSVRAFEPKRSVGPAAREAYVKAQYFLKNTGRNNEDLTKAFRYFREAVHRGPGYAEAYAGLANLYNMLGIFLLVPPKRAFERARKAAKKAIAIDESICEAHTALAYAVLMLEWDCADAERQFTRAIQLNRNCAVAHHWYAEYLLTIGQVGKAIDELERAKEIEPFSLIHKVACGWGLYAARRYDLAIQHYRRAVELDSNFAAAHFCLGMAYSQKRRYQAAIGELSKAMVLGGNLHVLRALGYAYAAGNEKLKAQEILETLKTTPNGYSASYAVATIYAALGEKDRAFKWLFRAYKERDAEFMKLRWDPQIDNLRSDSRFQHLLSLVGVVHDPGLSSAASPNPN